MTFESDYDAVLTVQARRDRLDEAIAAMAAHSEFTPFVRRLGCRLVPSELSSGTARVRGPITKRATPMRGGCWSRPPGTTAPATSSARPCATCGGDEDQPCIVSVSTRLPGFQPSSRSWIRK